MARKIKVEDGNWLYNSQSGWAYLCPADSMPGMYDADDVLVAQRQAAKKYAKETGIRVDAGTVAVEY